jgi:flavin-dependent dehydrogenase
MTLTDGSRVAIVGGGPAGSFSAVFILNLARLAGIKLNLDIFEPKDFTRTGPPGCNHCGGVVSESLLQLLAAEGLVLPENVVMEGIEGYVLHSDGEEVGITTPLAEKRIAAVFRGAGPKDAKDPAWSSFDGHLLALAQAKGAKLLRAKAETITKLTDSRLQIRAGDESHGPYDLVVGACGLSREAAGLFAGLGFGYTEPRRYKAAICELHLDEETVASRLGESMHVFLQDIPGLKFAAIIPKRSYATACLLGDAGKEAMDAFLTSAEVRGVFPDALDPSRTACACLPNLNVGFHGEPFGDRIALVGDCGVTRLYKDGIGAAYRVAKNLAQAVVAHGVSAKDLRAHFAPACAQLRRDNLLGNLCFLAVDIIKKLPFLRRAMLRMTAKEQCRPGHERLMSVILWDTFTGSAPYSEIFARAVNPVFLGRFAMEAVKALFSR